MVSALECPICMERYNAEGRRCVVICRMGHCCCRSCREALSDPCCPTCREALLPGSGIVNLLVERLLLERDHPEACLSPKSGCSVPPLLSSGRDSPFTVGGGQGSSPVLSNAEAPKDVELLLPLGGPPLHSLPKRGDLVAPGPR
eukprot:RCo002872